MNTDITHLFKQKSVPKGNLISIVLPLYNEEEALPFLLKELFGYLDIHQQKYRFEVLFVDDCSRDGSYAYVSNLPLQPPANVKVAVARLAKNSGSHIAITAGLNISRGDYTIIMASDGQDPAEVIGTLIAEWEAGSEIVLASRADNLDHNAIGAFFSKMAWKVMNWSTNIKMPETGCDMLGMDKKVLNAFNNMDERNTTFIFRILSLGYKQKEIQYIKRARVGGKSSWTFLKKISIILDAITGYSSRPLQLITKFGLAIFFLLIIRWIVVVVKIYIFKIEPSDLTIILNTIFTSLSIVVLLLGIIGDYIWRILDETRKRPIYEISEVAGSIFDDN